MARSSAFDPQSELAEAEAAMWTGRRRQKGAHVSGRGCGVSGDGGENKGSEAAEA
jgi:hypothetical protein